MCIWLYNTDILGKLSHEMSRKPNLLSSLLRVEKLKAEFVTDLQLQ